MTRIEGSLWPLAVTEILYSLRLVVEEKTGREIPKPSRLDFLEKFLPNNFVLSDAEDNTCRPLNKGGIADLPLLRLLLAICQKSWELSSLEVMDSFVLVAYASLTASRTLLQQLLACLNFTLDSEDLFCWYKRKKWFLWTMAAAQAAENHGDEWGLTWYLQWGIYTSIPPWTHSQNSLAAAEASSLKISCYATSLKWSQKLSQLSTRIVISYVMKHGIPFLFYWKITRKWDNNMTRIFHWSESPFGTNTSVRKKK